MIPAKAPGLSRLVSITQRLRRKGKKVVFTNGAFDILHAGHVQYLEKARALGDVLILGVNTDSSIRAYKGPHRPVNSQNDRLALLSALSCVDYVVLFSDATPIRLIRALKPAVLVKGADWKISDIVGASEVLSWGGKVKRIKFLQGRSTTGVIEKVLAHPEAAHRINLQQPSWKEKVFKEFRLYVVSDLKTEDSPDVFLKKAEAAYRGGADIVQLRAKQVSDAVLFRTGAALAKIAVKHQKLFFVNDRLDLVMALNADGLHLGQDDLPVSAARTILRKHSRKMWIGKSTHSLKQALKTVQEEVDYIGVGPVFATPTKPHYKAAGLSFVESAAARVKLPFVAIGGINEKNLQSVLQAGASRVAVVRAVFDARDPEKAARNLIERMKKDEH